MQDPCGAPKCAISIAINFRGIMNARSSIEHSNIIIIAMYNQIGTIFKAPPSNSNKYERNNSSFIAIKPHLLRRSCFSHYQ